MDLTFGGAANFNSMPTIPAIQYYNNTYVHHHSTIVVLQHTWCRQVFTSPLKVLVGVFTEAMTSLDPPPARCLSTALDTSIEPISTLISMRQVRTILLFAF